MTTCTYCHQPIDDSPGIAGDKGPVHLTCFEKQPSEVLRRAANGSGLDTMATQAEMKMAARCLDVARDVVIGLDVQEIIRVFGAELRRSLISAFGEGTKIDGLDNICTVTLSNGHRFNIEF